MFILLLIFKIFFSNEKSPANDDILSLIGLLVFPMSNLLNTSAAIFLEPFMYMSFGLYSSRISLYLMTLLVLNVLHVKFLYSVYTLICYPNNKLINLFRVSKMESSSRSVVV